MSVDIRVNAATVVELLTHLTQCSTDFVPHLSDRVDLSEYARKIAAHAVRFEAWDGELVGLVAVYRDTSSHSAFVTNVSVLRSHRSLGIASCLLSELSAYCEQNAFRRVSLEVDAGNLRAVSLYHARGFIVEKMDGRTMTLAMTLGERK